MTAAATISASQASIIDEVQTAPTELGAGAGFRLNQSFVIPASIVVVDTRNGSLLPTTAGIDYELVTEGNQTRVVPLLTSAVIRAGDPLAVSYVYALAPSLKYSTASRLTGASVNYGWISVAANHSQSQISLLAGSDNRFVQSSRSDTAQVDLHGTWKTLQARAGASTARTSSATVVSNEQRTYSSATYQFSRALGFALDADRSRSAYQLPDRQSSASGVRLSADWYTAGGWVVNAASSRRSMTDSLGPSEKVAQQSLKASLKYGKLSFTSSVSANQRLRASSELSNWRIDFSVLRSL